MEKIIVGMNVQTDDERYGTVTTIKSGWATVKAWNGEFKVRTSKLTQTEFTMDVDELMDDLTEMEAEEMVEMSAIELENCDIEAQVADTVMGRVELEAPPAEVTIDKELLVPNVTCGTCQYTALLTSFKIVKDSVQCPKCGTWIQVRIHAAREHYVRGLGTTVSGCDTFDIGDETADILRGLSADAAIYVTAGFVFRAGWEAQSKGFKKEYGKDRPWDVAELNMFLYTKYADRNPGMIRMNCGNILRGLMKKGAIGSGLRIS